MTLDEASRIAQAIVWGCKSKADVHSIFSELAVDFPGMRWRYDEAEDKPTVELDSLGELFELAKSVRVVSVR